MFMNLLSCLEVEGMVALDKAGKLGTTVQDCVSTLVKSGGVANLGTAKQVFVSVAPMDISKESWRPLHLGERRPKLDIFLQGVGPSPAVLVANKRMF